MSSKYKWVGVVENIRKPRGEWGVTLDTGRTSSEEGSYVSDDVLGGAGPWYESWLNRVGGKLENN